MTLFSILSSAARHADEIYAQLAARRYVEDFTEEFFKNLGAEAVVLDHDGVLGPSRSEGPDETGVETIRMAIEAFGPGRVFVLSNTRSKRDIRQDTYDRDFSGARYIKAERKPDPEGLKTVSRLSGVPVEKIAVIDDGLLTGILMAVPSGAIPVYAKRKRMNENLLAKTIRLSTTWPQIAVVRLFGMFF